MSNQTPLQDRPVYVIIISVISKLLDLVGVPTGSITYIGEDKIPQTYNVLNYGVFVLSNTVVLLVSLIIVLSVFFRFKNHQDRFFNLSIFLVLIFIAQNPINREYFWTPTSQIFNNLVPALLFYLAQDKLVLKKKQFYLWLSFMALALLVYPTMTILLPILMIRTFQSLGKLYALLMLLSLSPKLIWPLAVNFFGGNYVDWPVVGHRRFVWILDSIKSKTLWHDSMEHFFQFLNSLPLAWDTITILVLIIAITLHGKTNVVSTKLVSSRHFYSTIVLATYSGGMLLNGEYGPRFSTGVVLLFSFIVFSEIIQSKNRASIWKFAIYGCIFANLSYWFTS
jgi:hypothetical protein